jgi:D-sedoheptulose 7-phosphate isomerase
MSRAELARERIREATDVCRSLLEDASVVEGVDAIVGEIVESLRSGGKVLLCGNGGSAADAQHLAAELVGRFCLDRQPLPAVALADNVAAMTAISNDYGYSDSFSRAVRGLGRRGDVLIGLSTSGRSDNVIRALIAAREREMVTVALVGGDDSPMARASQYVVRVAGPNTARIQEAQMLVGHTIFELVERELCQT